METSESASEEDEAKYYSNIYYVDNLTVENADSAPKIIKNVSNKAKQIISKRYWSVSNCQGAGSFSRSQSVIKNAMVKNVSSGILEKIKKVLSDPLNKRMKSPKSKNINKNAKNNNLAKIGPEKIQNVNESQISKTIENAKSSKETILSSEISIPTIAQTKPDSTQSNSTQPILENDKKSDNVSASISPDPVTQFIKEVKEDEVTSTSGTTHVNEKQDSKPVIDEKIIAKSNVINLESSDDESVIETKLPSPPCIPTICLDSSDEEIVPEKSIKLKELSFIKNVSKKSIDKRCTSPVPSVVSSTSDDFIQTDCRNLNISEYKNSQNMKFNFQLHGSDFIEEPINKGSMFDNVSDPKFASSPKNRNSKNRQSLNQTEIVSKDIQMFATPKSKKKKGQNSKQKSYTVPEDSYAPFIDVYESESSDFPDSVIDVPINPTALMNSRRMSQKSLDHSFSDTVDTLVMANVVGVEDPSTRRLEASSRNDGFVIDVDAIDANKRDAPNHIDICMENKSMEDCIADMDKFYNQSWGGENFDHLKIQRELSNSKDLWAIDSADKYRDLLGKRNMKEVCSICNKVGHKEEKCFKKINKCYMCGIAGHCRARCPNSICLNCGSKTSKSFQMKCVNCKKWNSIKCIICNKFGHPKQNCPDLWRRYHLTLKNEIPLIQDINRKSSSNMYCSGCARKGHVASNCINFSSQYPLSSSYIYDYNPVYVPDGIRKQEIESRETKYDNTTNNSKRKLESTTEQNLMKRPRIDENFDAVSLKNNNMSHMFLSSKQLEGLSSADGLKSFGILSSKYNILCKIYFSTLGPVMFISGGHNDLKGFKDEFNGCYQHSESSMSQNKFKLIKDLSSDINLLNSFIGNPIKLYNSLENLQNHLKNLKMKNKHSSDVASITSNIDETCKKLNMILIGQAGYCNGKEYLFRLREEVNKLRQMNSEEVSSNARMNLSKLYFTIFSPLSQENYFELVTKFRDQLHTFPKWLKRSINLKKDKISNSPSADISNKPVSKINSQFKRYRKFSFSKNKTFTYNVSDK